MTLDEIVVGMRVRLADNVLPSLPTREGIVLPTREGMRLWGEVLIDLGDDGRYWVEPAEISPLPESIPDGVSPAETQVV